MDEEFENVHFPVQKRKLERMNDKILQTALSSISWKEPIHQQDNVVPHAELWALEKKIKQLGTFTSLSLQP